MGVITAKRERVSAASKVLKDEQTLADAEHTAGRDRPDLGQRRPDQHR